MTTRRELLAAAVFLGPLALTVRTAAATEGREKAGHAAEMADFLFVQNARAIVFADGKLTLKGVSPATVMFSDRPERIAGHMATAKFVPFWSEEGQVPATAGLASLFIDIIGMPLTPLSFAGARRRTWRRAVWR